MSCDTIRTRATFICVIAAIDYENPNEYKHATLRGWTTIRLQLAGANLKTLRNSYIFYQSNSLTVQEVPLNRFF